MGRFRTYALAVGALVALGGCGGGGQGSSAPTGPPPPSFPVSAAGVRFRVPDGWEVQKTPRSISASRSEGAVEIVSATRFPLVRPFRPNLWKAAETELDSVADRLASSLSGSVESSETVRVRGIRGRRYEIAYERDGAKLRERITLLLRGKFEYQLLCRWQEADGEPAACALLDETFRPA